MHYIFIVNLFGNINVDTTFYKFSKNENSLTSSKATLFGREGGIGVDVIVFLQNQPSVSSFCRGHISVHIDEPNSSSGMLVERYWGNTAHLLWKG